MKVTLAAARVNRGLTMDDVAQQLEVTRMALYNWETGKSKIFLPDFVRLVRLYKVDMNDISFRGLKGCEDLSDD